MALTDDLEKKSPYPLIPLNISGVYTSPAPPEHLDDKTSPAELIRHGILWRRPEPGDPPSVAAAWKALLSRRWYAKDRIVPHIVPQPGKFHVLRGVKRTEGSINNSSWSGCVLSNPGAWLLAAGRWVIPTVSKPSEPQGSEGGWNSSSWVGIDGFNSNDVLQAGIQQRVAANGQATYVAWYEWFVPAPPGPCPDPTGCDSNGYPLSWVGSSGQYRYIYQANITNFPVSPGQTVTASIQYINNKTAGYISFGNVTTGQNFTITLVPPPGANFSGNCIEWIMEAPDGGENISALPKFTPVNFTNALGCTSNVVGDPKNGQIFNIQTGTKILTSVVLASDAVTIDFIG
jgi:hypothetical protein